MSKTPRGPRGRRSLYRRGRTHIIDPYPRRALAWAWTVLVALAAVMFLMGAAGCGKSGGDQAAAGDGQNMAHAAKKKGNGNGRPSQPPIPIAVEAAHIGEIASYYTATATLAAEKQAEILARANGVVQELDCEEGDFVNEGDPLLRIDDSEYVLRVTQAVATTTKLTDQYNRLKGMWDRQLVSAEEFEAVKNDLKAAEAAEELARLNLSYTIVRAPFTGRITSRLVDVGQTVSAGTSLFIIADFDPLLAIVHVPSKEFKKLKPNQPVELALDSSGERLTGRIKLVSPIIDPSSGTIKVTVEIKDYPAGTRPGDFAEVSIVTERKTGRTLVKKEAVFADRGDQIVYIASANNTAERRVVEVGFEDDEHSEILSGIGAGDQVVVKGQRSLKHGAPIKIMNGIIQEAEPADTAAKRNQVGS